MAKLAFAQTVATLPLNTHPPPKTDTPLRNAPGEDGFCLGIPFGRDGNSLDFLKTYAREHLITLFKEPPAGRNISLVKAVERRRYLARFFRA